MASLEPASYTPVPLAYKTVEPEGGASDKAPIIFAHGRTTSKEYWGDFPQVVANGTKRKVYAIDARNHGDSEWSDVWNYDCNVDDLIHFMDTMKIQKAILYGHCMGSITCMKTALRVPERVEKMVNEDMMAEEMFTWTPMFSKLAREAVQSVPRGVDEDTAKRTIISFINGAYEGQPSESKTILGKNLSMQLKRTVDGNYRYKFNLDRFQALRSDSLMSDLTGVYEGPELHIYENAMTRFRENTGPVIRELIPNAEFHGVAHTSHVLHADRPLEFMEAVFEFLLR